MLSPTLLVEPGRGIPLAPPVTITVGTTADLAAVPLALPILRGELGESSSEGQVEETARGYMGREDSLWLVARRGDEVVGTVLAQAVDRGFMIERKSAFVDVVAVVPAERGSGIGAALLLVTENWARRRGATGLVIGIPKTSPMRPPPGFEVSEVLYRKKV